MSKIVAWKQPVAAGQSCERCNTTIAMHAYREDGKWDLALVCQCMNTPMRVGWVKANTSAEILSMAGFEIRGC